MIAPEQVQRVRTAVQAFDAQLEPILFSEQMKTTEEAAAVLGVETGQIAKTLLFRTSQGYGLFVTAGDMRIRNAQVKELLGGGNVKMATPQEVEEITGFQVGAVCPFALRQEVPIFIDASLSRFDRVYTAAGIAESLLPVSFVQLVGITGGKVIELVSVSS
ncbi:YbaK/EbsC family protein [Brevibacillus migulae]|uniref:YbaK/EbsC family protein n=1 Tax=Brevibacillus migulae TaxID=1644114 RepID=UPI00106E52BD|nr:YbaK/EbsC family protein [Brevibacillus migulae]